MKALVAVEDEGLIEALGDDGIEVVPVRTDEEREQALKEPDISFAVADERLPFAYDLIVDVRADLDGRDRDRLPVLLLEGGWKGPARLRCLPDQCLRQGVGSDDVVRTARAIMIRRARQKRLFEQELALKVPTTPATIEQVGDIYVRLMTSAGYTDEDQVRLEHTFREAVGNAAEHGNKQDPTRTIHVTYLRTPEQILTVVRDEGSGFDHRSFLARAGSVSALEHTRSRRESEARPGGLGVFIMKETCDRIAFNGCGNAIYLAKRLPRHSEAAASTRS